MPNPKCGKYVSVSHHYSLLRVTVALSSFTTCAYIKWPNFTKHCNPAFVTLQDVSCQESLLVNGLSLLQGLVPIGVTACLSGLNKSPTDRQMKTFISLYVIHIYAR